MCIATYWTLAGYTAWSDGIYWYETWLDSLSSTVQYRFNETSHSYMGIRKPLAKYLNANEYTFHWAQTLAWTQAWKKTSSKQFEKLNMIIRPLIITNYIFPPVGYTGSFS